MAKSFKEYITESFNKSYSYRIKFAGNYDDVSTSKLESILGKYGVEKVTPFKRTPIQEEPLDFKNKRINGPHEVSSCDITLKYPVNEKLLEVWIAVNMGMESDYVVVQPVASPRTLEDDLEKARVERDADRFVNEEDAELAKEEQAHYVDENAPFDLDELGLYGEEFNKKFIDELIKVRNEKGADYFRNYPSKGMMMGDDLKPLADLMGLSHNPRVKGDSYDINQGPVVQ